MKPLMRRDPTYVRAEIEANPDWALAFLMSEIDNDGAPIGWGKYISLATSLREKFTLASKGGPYETPLQIAAAKSVE